jgi:thymidylate synthase
MPTVSEEVQYLDLVRNILANGDDRPDRTGVGTLSLFGAQMRFSLADSTLPLLTTKPVFWRGVVEELMWIMRGKTSSLSLAARNVNIWNANGTREFLDKRGLAHRAVGDLGPVYGFQWRHFGAAYRDAASNYHGLGVDQLQNVISSIKADPYSRRHLISAWNPTDLDQMALPPCHILVQFSVSSRNELSCHMYQRSADMGLGVPFNIASYALLTHLIARVTGLKAHVLILSFGDVHVYKNHVDPLREQITRTPHAFPKLAFTDDAPSVGADICSILPAHLLPPVNYSPHGPISMEMAV